MLLAPPVQVEQAVAMCELELPSIGDEPGRGAATAEGSAHGGILGGGQGGQLRQHRERPLAPRALAVDGAQVCMHLLDRVVAGARR